MDDATLLSWINTGRNVAALLVAIGVAGEFVGDFIASPIHRRIDTARAEEIAHLTKDAADARKDAEGFRLDIAGANARAALAEQHSAEANLELAKLKTPRTLNHEQQRRISETVKPFAGKQFDVALTIDPEAQDLLPHVEDALRAAGWIEIDWKGTGKFADINFTRPNRPVAGIASISGVIIQMHPEHISDSSAAAQILASALRAEGISAKAERGLGVDNSNTTAIHVLIGKKP